MPEALTRPQPGLIAPAAIIAVAALYAIGLDQGWLLSLVQGDVAFDQNLLHELIHDARHAAGFPCH